MGRRLCPRDHPVGARPGGGEGGWVTIRGAIGWGDLQAAGESTVSGSGRDIDTSQGVIEKWWTAPNYTASVALKELGEVLSPPVFLETVFIQSSEYVNTESARPAPPPVLAPGVTLSATAAWMI